MSARSSFPAPAANRQAAPAPPPHAGSAARPGALRRLFGPVVDGRTWSATAHLLLDLPLGIAGFTVVVTGVSLAAGLLITLVGIPVLVVTLWLARAIGAIDRGRARALLGARVPAPVARRRGRGGLWVLVDAMRDTSSWKAVAYCLLMLPVGIVTFTVTVVMWSVALGGLTWSAWGWATSRGDDNYVLWVQTPLTTWEYVWLAALQFAVGLLFLVISPRVVRGLARVDVAIVRGLLGRGHAADLEERVTQLSESREASVDAAETERRRIERDLHDGAQQRLVAMAMDLGLARERLEASGDERTAELVGSAHDEAKRAITELRELVRGIHPAVLADRGLDAALSAVAARCPVPVDVHVDLPARPPGSVETAAYYVVAEALTNVAKHARATSARVRVWQRDDAVVVEVTDDGVGGAVAGQVGGLAGLRDRVRAVEGTLRIASPPGGPTTLLVELPCGS